MTKKHYYVDLPDRDPRNFNKRKSFTCKCTTGVWLKLVEEAMEKDLWTSYLVARILKKYVEGGFTEICEEGKEPDFKYSRV